MAVTMVTVVQNRCCCSSLPSPSPRPSSASPRFASLQSILYSAPQLRGLRTDSLEKWRRAARYTRFETVQEEEGPLPNKLSGSVDDDTSDDSVLPPDLDGAILQASQSSAEFISAGGMRAIVELLLPELEFLNDEGSQENFWQLARQYLETLREDTGVQKLKAIFPDAGAAALLKHWWKDANFSFASLSDRKPVEDEDEIVVMIAPDYQMLQSVERIASLLSDNLPRPLIMWNPRLFSGDVGVGLNVRRLRSSFLRTFTVVYSMKPLTSGAVFRCYPRMWQIFLDDKERPGRYILAKEQPKRPDADDIDLVLFGGKKVDEEEKPSFLVETMSTIASFGRFMRSLTK